MEPGVYKASSNKCIATSNKCLTSSNKKLLETFFCLRMTRQAQLLVLGHHASEARRSSSLCDPVDVAHGGAKGIATRSKDATRGSWPYY